LCKIVYRITYQIVGRLRFLSHKELMRMMVRACRRARLPLAYSQGFHPHPLLSFGPPRSTGMAGTAEQFDVRLTSLWEPARLADALQAQMPRGATIVAATRMPDRTPALTAATRAATYACAWPLESPPPQAAIAAVLQRDSIVVPRSTGAATRMVNLRPGIHAVWWQDATLYLQLALAPALHVRPQEVLAVMTGWPETVMRRIAITRTGLHEAPTAPCSSPELYGTRNPD
jgi:radical SAM-linked protein